MSFSNLRLSTFALSFLCGSAAADPIPANATDLPEITITGKQAQPDLFRLGASAPLPATVDVPDLRGGSDERAENALMLAGIGSTSTNNGGLGTGLNLRGFDIGSRLVTNGHPDIFRMFVRDLATVEQIEVLKGHSSVLYGQGAPGGTVNYVLARPSGVQRTEVALTADNHGWGRLVMDHDQPLGADDGLRAIYAGQAGGTFIENVDNRRDSLLLSGIHRTRGGNIRAEVELQRNQRPFPFGTVYAGGRFWFDRYYIAPATHALREYWRTGLYWDQALTNGWALNASANVAHIQREETLAGFWTIASPTTLSSYYRKLNDDAGQNNLRLELRGHHALAGMNNDMLLGYQQDRQHLDFSGPQSIGVYSISLANPDFNLNWDALKLTPRITRERYRESGLFWLDQLQVTEALRLAAGLRNSAVEIATANATTSATAADIRHTTSMAGLTWQPNSSLTMHLARSESFEPNRGTTHAGTYLQPREGKQWEAGLGIEGSRWAMKLAAFDLEQTNLTAVDPQDKDAFVTIGTIHSRGMETAMRVDSGAIKWSANVTLQQVRNAAKTSSSLGDRIVNVPTVLGALRIDWRTSADWLLWSSLAGVGSRAGNTHNTFTAPGFATLNAGMKYQINAQTSATLSVTNMIDKRYVEALSAEDNVYQGERRRISVTFKRQL